MTLPSPAPETNPEKWTQGLLSDIAGRPSCAAELLQAVWDVQAGRIPEWSMQYNIYGVDVLPAGARITFNGKDDDGCSVPLELLASIVAAHLGL